ncbi:hypothetical protein [Streptomyces sp. PT19]|uniref:hypothetical protein n=1 Tax=Streptomyces sp. PT19 TaxID=3452239 RepID=UPI003F7E3C55
MSATSMLHEPHRLMGCLVRDTISGRTGVLRAIAPDGDVPKPVAWLRPAGGGREWTTPPKALELVGLPTSGQSSGGRR